MFSGFIKIPRYFLSCQQLQQSAILINLPNIIPVHRTYLTGNKRSFKMIDTIVFFNAFILKAPRLRLQTMPCAFSLIDESIIISKMALRSQNLSISWRLTSSGIRETMVFSSCSEEKSPMLPSPNLKKS